MKYILLILMTLLMNFVAFAESCPPQKVGDQVVSFNSVQGGIEFRNPAGKVELLILDDMVDGTCLKLAQPAAVMGKSSFLEIEYLTAKSGTSFLVQEKKYVVIDVKKKKPLFEPVDVERSFDSKSGPSKELVAKVEWKKSPHLSIEVTDLETKKVSTVFSTAPKSE